MSHCVLNSIALLPAARRCRLLVAICGLLILWASFDAQILLLASSGNVLPASQNSPSSQDDGDDDDYLLNLSGERSTHRSSLRKVRPPLPRLDPQIVTRPCFSFASHRRPLQTTHVSEHDFRNGIGAPLLC